MSENVTQEAAITGNCWFLPLYDTPEKWADFILQHRNMDRTSVSWIGKTKKYSLEDLKEQQIQLIRG